MTSEKLLERKKQEVEKIGEIFSKSGVYLFDYRGMTVPQMSRLREKVKALDADIKVVKNRLAIKYFESKNKKEYGRELFNGPMAAAYADKNFVDVAKLIIEAEKEFEHINLKAGFIEQIFADKERVKQVSKLPGKEQLMAQLVLSLAMPLKKFGMSLSAPLTHMLILMKNLKDKKEKELEK
ncbi:MAG: 50S ribosomal protein L10 [Candidatus Aminicenantes bacterium]|nr:50S ribosomal protein L10 [Candidatus Aminicenantes bacterium]